MVLRQREIPFITFEDDFGWRVAMNMNGSVTARAATGLDHLLIGGRFLGEGLLPSRFHRCGFLDA
jgi:hypothetical protein